VPAPPLPEVQLPNVHAPQVRPLPDLDHVADRLEAAVNGPRN
jgi:hypothetical protein